jgi:hypothetical protein
LLNFDHPGIDVASITVITAGPGGTRSLTVQSYDGSIGKAAARLESLETAGTPIKGEVVEYMARLERRGYRIVAATDDAEPAAKKPRRGLKAAEPAEPVRSRRGRRKAD